MLVSAALHMCLLVVNFFSTFDTDLFNLFSIIELDKFYPAFTSSVTGTYGASFAALGIYIFAYFFLTQKTKK